MTVYDISARDTFESLSSWIAELDTFAGTGNSSRDVVRMIVGNKVDKVHLSVFFTIILLQFHWHDLFYDYRSSLELFQVKKEPLSLQVEIHLGCLWNVQLRKVEMK